MRDWAYKRDEAGNSRRFFNHREAFGWTGKLAGMVAGISLLQAVYGYFASDDSYVVFFVPVGLALGL